MKTLFIILATILLAIPLAVLMFVNLPGFVVLSAIILVAIPFYLHDKKSRMTDMDSAVLGAHTLSVPELGLTMADGGEKVDSSGKSAGKES
jgi:4-hydroxybenzoate polyprenyltransferase